MPVGSPSSRPIRGFIATTPHPPEVPPYPRGDNGFTERDVIPAKRSASRNSDCSCRQRLPYFKGCLDSRFRGNDGAFSNSLR